MSASIDDRALSRFRIIERNGGKPPLTYHQFQNVVASMDPPEPSVPTVTSACIGSAYTPLKEDHDDHYGVPTLEELGKFTCLSIAYLFRVIRRRRRSRKSAM